MNPIQTFGVLSLVFVGGMFSGWTMHGWKHEADRATLSAKLLAAAAENDRLKTDLEVKKSEELKTVATLAADTAARRLRLPKGCLQPEPAGGSASQAAGTGALPAQPQDALDRFTAGVGRLAVEADEMLATCRVVVEWAKIQGGRNAGQDN